MPDANGAVRWCFTKEMFDSGQLAAGGVGTPADDLRTSTRSAKHLEVAFELQIAEFRIRWRDGLREPESYRTKMTTTATVQGKTNTTTRIVQAKWLGADCGDVKPITPASLGR